MQSTASTPASPAVGGTAWRTLAVAGGLFAVQTVLLLVVFHTPLLVIPVRALETDPYRAVYLFKWAGVFGVAIAAACLAALVRRHPEEYRRLPLSLPRLAIQLATLALLATWLQLAAAGRLRPVLGNRGDLLLGAAAVAAWVAATLALVLPRPALVARFAASFAAVSLAGTVAFQAGQLTEWFWGFSSTVTMGLVERFLAPFVPGPVVRPGEFVIGTADFQVGVGPSCGGAHGIGLMAVLIAGYLWWFRSLHRFPQSLLLFPAGLALVWAANIVRITALILVGVYISPEIAVDGFHSTAGWIAFLTVGLGLIWTAARMPFFSLDASPPPLPAAGGEAVTALAAVPAARDVAAGGAAVVSEPVDRLPSATACLLPFVVLTATTMLTQAFTSGFNLLYPLRLVATAAALWSLRGQLAWRSFTVSPAAAGIGAAAFAAWMVLVPGPSDPLADFTAARDPFLALDRPWAIAWLVCRAVGAIVTVPVAEELAFRGFLLHRLVSDDVEAVPPGRFTWPSFLGSSLAFGLLHGADWIAATVAGMLFAAALYRRGRLADAVVAHSTTNALLSTYVIATGSWSSWG